jgi:hypothetical protein
VLTKGTSSTDGREGEEEGRDNKEWGEKAARKYHDKERICCSAAYGYQVEGSNEQLGECVRCSTL